MNSWQIIHFRFHLTSSLFFLSRCGVTPRHYPRGSSPGSTRVLPGRKRNIPRMTRHHRRIKIIRPCVCRIVPRTTFTAWVNFAAYTRARLFECHSRLSSPTLSHSVSQLSFLSFGIFFPVWIINVQRKMGARRGYFLLVVFIHRGREREKSRVLLHWQPYGVAFSLLGVVCHGVLIQMESHYGRPEQTAVINYVASFGGTRGLFPLLGALSMKCWRG